MTTYTARQIADALQDAIYSQVSGQLVSSVTVGDKTIQWRSAQELTGLHRYWEGRAQSENVSRASRITYGSHRRFR